MVETGTHESWDPQPGSRLHGIVCFIPAILCTFGIAGFMLLLALCWPSQFRRSRSRLLRCWGRTGLFLCGVRLETHGTEHLEQDGGHLVLFNHQSLLDLFIMSSLWSDRSVVIYKKEFHKVPIIGRLMKHLDLIPVDRSDRERAVESMRAAGRRVCERGELLLVAPEGSRSRKSGLIAFKRGPFHVALDTGLPLVVLIMRGVRTLLPTGSFVARSGTLRVDVLPPIATSHWEVDTLDAHMADVRRVFLAYLPDAEAATTETTEEPEAGPGITSGLH